MTEHTPKPTFTDVQRREIIARTVTKNDVPVLAIDEVGEDGEAKRLMLLNKYDAKQLAAACELYLQAVFSAQFTNMSTSLSPAEMVELFGTDGE